MSWVIVGSPLDTEGKATPSGNPNRGQLCQHLRPKTVGYSSKQLNGTNLVTRLLRCSSA